MLPNKNKLYLLVLDLFGIYFSFVIASYLRFDTWKWSIYESSNFWILFGVTFGVFYIFDLYRQDSKFNIIRIFVRYFFSFLVITIFVILYSYSLGVTRFEGSLFGRFMLPVGMGLFMLFSIICRFVYYKSKEALDESIRWLVISPMENYQLLMSDIDEAKILGQFHHMDYNDLDSQFKVAQFDRVIVAPQLKEVSDDIFKQIFLFRNHGTPVYTLENFYESYFNNVPLAHIQDARYFMSSRFSWSNTNWYQRLKRISDIVFSLALFILTFPLFLFTALLIKAFDKGPIFYTQKRVGLDEKEFTIFKFRTMRVDAEQSGAQWAMVDDHRITKVGAFLRVTRIDELPQLFNLIKGDMSFIGPRPERMVYVKKLKQEIAFYGIRHSMRPGLTGWAQVSYPYGSTKKDALKKLEYELFYIKNHSPVLDLVIFLKTINVVVFGKGR